MVNKTKMLPSSWSLQKVGESNNEKYIRWGTMAQWHSPVCVVSLEVHCSDSLSMRRVSIGQLWEVWSGNSCPHSSYQHLQALLQLQRAASSQIIPILRQAAQGEGNKVGPFQPEVDNSNGQCSFQSTLQTGWGFVKPTLQFNSFLRSSCSLPISFHWNWSLINILLLNLHLNICF